MSTFFSPDESAANAPERLNQVNTAEAASPLEMLERRQWRHRFLAFVLVTVTAVVIMRLFIYQIVQWGDTVAVGKAHSGPPSRGVIVDRSGMLLAADRFYYQVAATPNNLRNDEDRRTVANQLEELVGIPANSTLSLLTTFKDKPFVELFKNLPLEQGHLIEQLKAELTTDDNAYFPLQTVYITPVPKRYYPQRQLAGHMLGFTNQERAAFYGLESYYNRFLLADSGITFTDKPQSLLADLPLEMQRFLPSLANKDLILTLDSTIQWICEDELAKGLAEYKAQRGTIIVMNPVTGEILAMASLPSYDPNRYGDAEFSQFLDPAISQQYEPGSVMKVVTMAAGLDTGVITPTMRFNDTGSFSIGNRVIFNSQLIGYGDIAVRDALALSLNVVTAQIASEIGQNRFYDYMRRFGFGSATEVDLAGEVPGAIKYPGTLDWSLSDLGTNSFGQGIAVTPLQMVNSVAAIANGGKLMRPYVVAARVHNGEVLETEPTVVHTVMSQESARQLSELMVYVVEKGNKQAQVLGYQVAGKSGTAQIPTIDGYLLDQVNASFVGFAPAQDPQIAVLVRLERPDQTVTLWASENTAPIFSRIVTRILHHMGIPPDEQRGVAPITFD